MNPTFDPRPANAIRHCIFERADKTICGREFVARDADQRVCPIHSDAYEAKLAKERRARRGAK